MGNCSIAQEWFAGTGSNSRAQIRLFCFPFAGGGASFYHPWLGSFSEQIEVMAALLPGRERRITEPAISDLPLLIERLSEAILEMTDKPFAFFGHSLGALISFELARKLRSSHKVSPKHLFVSSFRAPHLSRKAANFHDVSDEELINRVEKLNGASGGLLQSPELRELVLPMLRADFRISELYVHQQGQPLGCPITAFGGKQDPVVDIDMLRQWRDHTVSEFQMQLFDGGHFYIKQAEKQVTGTIMNELLYA